MKISSNNAAVRLYVLLMILSVFIPAQACRKKVVNPLNMGLKKAKSGIERYEIIKSTHEEALKNGYCVSYSGIKNIDIEIPDNAQSIPVGDDTDFNGVTFTVTNNKKTIFLFSLTQQTSSINIPAKNIDSGNFSSYRELNNGTYLLAIQDDSLWVKQRIGYNYGHTRKDVMLIENGISQTMPIMPYDNHQSRPSCRFCMVTTNRKSFGNITMRRHPSSTKSTYLLKVENQYNVYLHDITVHTPNPGSLYGDMIFAINNCVDVTAENILIDGTYSQTNKYGYGFNLNNVLRYTAISQKSANCNWGVYGTNNLQDSKVINSDINRFDIHCYGRNVDCVNCTFNNFYNQFSCTYGNITFSNCRFKNFRPIVDGCSYNTNVESTYNFYDCDISISDKVNSLVTYNSIHKEPNPRPELSQRHIPSINVKNTNINVENSTKSFSIFKITTSKDYTFEAVGTPQININGMTFTYNNAAPRIIFNIFDHAVSLKESIDINIDNLLLTPESNPWKEPSAKYTYPYSINFNVIDQHKKTNIHISHSKFNYHVNNNYLYAITFDECEIGCVRFVSSSNKDSNLPVRTYNNCIIHLNSIDNSEAYYIDNFAYYNNSTFIATDNQKPISYYGNINRIKFIQCNADNQRLGFDIKLLNGGTIIGKTISIF